MHAAKALAYAGFFKGGCFREQNSSMPRQAWKKSLSGKGGGGGGGDSDTFFFSSLQFFYVIYIIG